MKFKALLALVFLCNYLNGQLTDINDSDWFRSGNFLVKELTSTVNNDIKGTPYLNKTFENGQIIFSNGNSYMAMMRLNIGNQKFEILNTENKVTEINLDNNTKVLLNNKTYSLHSIKINGVQTIVLLDECNIDFRYKLYYYPKKNVEIPKKPNTPAPSSGFEKSEMPEWKNYSAFYLFFNDKYYEIPNSHKKMANLEILKDFDYKTYRKKNKLNLKDRESLSQLVNHLNKKQIN